MLSSAAAAPAPPRERAGRAVPPVRADRVGGRAAPAACTRTAFRRSQREGGGGKGGVREREFLEIFPCMEIYAACMHMAIRTRGGERGGSRRPLKRAPLLGVKGTCWVAGMGMA